MAKRLGKHQAQATLQDMYLEARRSGAPVATLLAGVATEAELAAAASIDLGASGDMVDRVVQAARERRAVEGPEW